MSNEEKVAAEANLADRFGAVTLAATAGRTSNANDEGAAAAAAKGGTSGREEGGEQQPSSMGGTMQKLERIGRFDPVLFAEPPPRAICDICMLPLPLDERLSSYSNCCGKMLCGACDRGHQMASYRVNEKKTTKRQPLLDNLCPFCRVPLAKGMDEIKARLEKRAEMGDPTAIKDLGFSYMEGGKGYPVDHGKALEYLLKAAEMGNAAAYYGLGGLYIKGGGEIDIDVVLGTQYLREGAKRGDIQSRHMLGLIEYEIFGDKDLAVKHWRTAAAAGLKKSADKLIKCCREGIISKSDLEGYLRAKHEAWAEMHSEERGKYIQFLKRTEGYEEK